MEKASRVETQRSLRSKNDEFRWGRGIKAEVGCCLGAMIPVSLLALFWFLSVVLSKDGTGIEIQNFNSEAMTDVAIVGSTTEGSVGWTKEVPDVLAGKSAIVWVPRQARELSFALYFKVGGSAYSCDDFECSAEGKGLVIHSFAFWEDNHVDFFCSAGD
ncbi:MAG: hypothetical protein ACJAZ8_000091 [Planctomycetota bacterium]|jgi:hypothetical protein